MKKHKVKIKIIVLIALGAVLMALSAKFIVTEIQASKIPHRFASAEEGAEIMLNNTEYYNQLTQNDIDFRMKKSGATLEEFMEASGNSVRKFSIVEKLYIDKCLAKMYRTLKKNGYVLPDTDEIVLIKADMTIESGNSGYTHGTEIYLDSTIVTTYTYLHAISGDYFDTLLWHEMFHCLTRCNEEFRAQMYSLIHFTVADSDYEIPPCVKEQYISNPDVENHDSYAAFVIDGQEVDCFTVWITTKSYEEAQTGFSNCNEVVLVPIDGTDCYYTKEQASNFNEVFGENTGYVIDPEECMADNFKYAMCYGMAGENGQGYPNPEIIQGILDCVSQ